MATILKDIFVVGKAKTTSEPNGASGSSVSFSPNLESPKLAKLLRRGLIADPNLVSDFALADKKAEKYITQHLGPKAVRGVEPQEKELLDKLRGLAPKNKDGGEKAGAPLSINTRVEVEAPTSARAGKAAGVATDQSRLEASLDSYDNGGRFSMIVALSQWQLNNTFELIYNMFPDRQVLKFTEPLTGSGFDSQLLPPQVAIDVAQETTLNRGRAIYFMRFGKTGTATFKYPGKPDATVSTKDWVFAFGIDLELIEVDKNSEEYNEQRQKLGKEGDYRISRLVANFENADIFHDETDLSYFGESEDLIRNEMLLSFDFLMLAWTQNARQTGAGILGYSATVDEAPESAATFPPTSQQLQAYPFLKPGQSYPVTSVGEGGENNSIVFLNMVQDLPFPNPSKLPYTGNWCTPIDRGTIAIGNQLFFEQFILPRLAGFNKSSFREPLEPKIEYKGIQWILTFRRGYDDHKGIYWASGWDKSPNSSGSAIGWSWIKENHERGSRQVNGLGRCTLDHTIRIHNRVFVSPGSNIISVYHEFRDTRKTSIRWVGTQAGTGVVRRFVTYQIHLQSILEGKLALQGPDPVNVQTTRSIDADFLFDSGYVKDMANELATELKNDKSLPRAVTDISKRLGTQNSFVLPGGAYLFMNDPMFNKDGDLLARLEANGV